MSHPTATDDLKMPRHDHHHRHKISVSMEQRIHAFAVFTGIRHQFLASLFGFCLTGSRLLLLQNLFFFSDRKRYREKAVALFSSGLDGICQ